MAGLKRPVDDVPDVDFVVVDAPEPAAGEFAGEPLEHAGAAPRRLVIGAVAGAALVGLAVLRAVTSHGAATPTEPIASSASPRPSQVAIDNPASRVRVVGGRVIGCPDFLACITSSRVPSAVLAAFRSYGRVAVRSAVTVTVRGDFDAHERLLLRTVQLRAGQSFITVRVREPQAGDHAGATLMCTRAARIDTSSANVADHYVTVVRQAPAQRRCLPPTLDLHATDWRLLAL